MRNVVISDSTIAGIQGNAVRDVRVRNNRIEATDTAVLVAGGYAKGSAPGSVTDNTVGIREITGNTDAAGQPASCAVRVDRVQDGPASVSGNRATGATASCPIVQD